MTSSAPFPLEGGRAGDGGGGTASPLNPEDSIASSTDDGVSSAHAKGRVSTPPNPPPRGEGFDGFDRFERPSKIKAGGIERARKLRAQPTFTEAKLWKRLRTSDVRFRRQAPIGPYVVDFACHSAKLIIEVDGGVHDLTDVALRDLKRDDWFCSQGYRVLRIPTKRVEADIDAVIADIEKAVGVSVPHPAGRASTPSQPFPLEGKGSSDV